VEGDQRRSQITFETFSMRGLWMQIYGKEEEGNLFLLDISVFVGMK
jgi:hypothetical protein